VTQKEQFIQEIQAHRGLIYKAATLYTSNAQDREDLVQEITYQLWKSYDSFEQKSNRGTWIYRVAMNVAIQFLKKDKRRPSTIPLDQQTLDLQDEASDQQADKWKKIQHQIHQLNLVEKGIILLYLERKSHREIAEIIGLSESNVGTKISRIKLKLKKKLTKPPNG